MEIHYKDKHIESLCNDSNYAAKYFPPKICINLMLLMSRLDHYPHYDVFYTMYVLKHYRAHQLKGRKKGIESLRLDRKYRMELILEREQNEIGEDVITILEVTNHYGD